MESLNKSDIKEQEAKSISEFDKAKRITDFDKKLAYLSYLAKLSARDFYIQYYSNEGEDLWDLFSNVKAEYELTRDKSNIENATYREVLGNEIILTFDFYKRVYFKGETITDILRSLKHLSLKLALYFSVTKINKDKYQIHIIRISDFSSVDRIKLLEVYEQDVDNAFNLKTIIALENTSHWVNGKNLSEFEINKEFKF